jgi:hypothetical protein
MRSNTHGKFKKTCSRKCKSALFSSLTSAPKETKTCLECGVEFQVPGTKRGRAKATCSRKCRLERQGKRITAYNKEFASERMRQNNPMRNAETRAKVSRTLKEIGHQPRVRGGNGKSPTVAEAFVFDLLSAHHPDWEMQSVVKLGVKRPGWPTCYKIDVGNPTLMLAIEVDGGSHSTLKRKASDQRKDERLRSFGWRVLRLRNEEAMADGGSTILRWMAQTTTLPTGF